MDRQGAQLLACACFPADEDSRIGLSHNGDLPYLFAEGRAFSKQLSTLWQLPKRIQHFSNPPNIRLSLQKLL